MSASPFPALETQRLVLREIVAADAPALFAIHGDADAMRWFGNDPLADLAGAEGLVSLFASWRNLPNPGVRWGIQVKDASGLIGTCGLFAWQRKWRKCAIGYELAAGAQGQGYMQEALTAAIDWGFEAMELNRIEAQVHPDNLASYKSLRRLGYVEEGRLRQVGFWGGAFHDMLQFSLLRSDWQRPIPESIRRFWVQFEAVAGAGVRNRFYEAFHFDDNEASANDLAALVLAGPKRATAGLEWSLEGAGKRAPRAGDLSVVTDWQCNPLCIIETSSVQTVPFEAVSEEFAATEGEGDGSLRHWREVHWACFERECARTGRRPSLGMPVVCERFDVVYRPARLNENTS